MDIYSLLSSNDVVVGEEKFQREILRSEGTVKEQIDLIIEIETILMGYKNIIIPTINSTIGKELEGDKVIIRKTAKLIKELTANNNKSDLDIFIIEESKYILQRATKAINDIKYNEYLDLIRRSMNRYEICIGRGDESNLGINKNGQISIKSIKYLSYNLIDHDIINYIKKIKRKGYKGNINNIIDYFIIKAGLDNKSKEYIRALVNYPYDGMKILNKYYLGKGSQSTKEWISEINLAKKNDGNEL